MRRRRRSGGEERIVIPRTSAVASGSGRLVCGPVPSLRVCEFGCLIRSDDDLPEVRRALEVLVCLDGLVHGEDAVDDGPGLRLGKRLEQVSEHLARADQHAAEVHAAEKNVEGIHTSTGEAANHANH